jgi:hypothetical protein
MRWGDVPRIPRVEHSKLSSGRKMSLGDRGERELYSRSDGVLENFVLDKFF